MNARCGARIGAGRRLASWGWDYLIILAWLIGVFVMVGVPSLLGWLDLERVWAQPITADMAAAMLTVVPFLVYLVITESGAHHATWGKRRSGLAVARHGTAGPVGILQVIARNVIKVGPWQFGHLASMRFAIQSGSQDLAVVAFWASMLLLVLVAGPAIAGRRGLHDLVAGTRVVPTAARPQ